MCFKDKIKDAIDLDKMAMFTAGIMVLFGVLIVFIDALVDYLFFYNSQSLANAMIFNISPHEIYMRLILFVCFTTFGIIFAIITHKRRELHVALKKKTHNLNERMKELDCLYRISKLIENHTTPTQLYQGIVELVPPSWQYPDITCAKLVIGDSTYQTHNFKETDWEQSSDIYVSDNVVGFLKVYHLEEMPILDEGSFLNEERTLVDAIAERIGRVIWRKQMEEELVIEHKHLTNIIEGTGAATWEWNIPEHTVRFSTQWKALRGYFETEIDNSEKEWANGIHPDDLPRVMEAVQAHFAGETDYFLEEYRICHKNGLYLWVLDRGKATTDINGNVISMAGVEIDITKSKQAEEALLEKDRLEGALLMARTCCHEMAQPMQAIVGGAELIEMDMEDAGMSGSKHIKQLIEQVLRLRETLTKTHNIVRVNTDTGFDEKAAGVLINLDKSVSPKLLT